MGWDFGEHGQRRELSLYNFGDQEIPAFGACEIAEAERPDASGAITPGGGRIRYKVKRPTADSLDAGKVIFNGPVAIPVGEERGIGFHEPPTYALFYAAGGTPAVGDGLGTAADSFMLAKGNQGFVAWGDVHGSLVMVARSDIGPALFVHATTTESLESGEASASVQYYWRGENPGSTVTVKAAPGTPGKCYPTGTKVVAAYDERESAPDAPVYRIVDIPLRVAELPVDNNPAYVLGVSAGGCMVRVPVDTCDGGGSGAPDGSG